MSQNSRILAVDDDWRIARTLQDIFRVQGYEAEVAHSGPEALDKVRESGFDCVLTDIKMPGMDGARLFRSIREMQPQLPVVFMTAYSTGKVVQEVLEEGAIATLTKPLDIDAVLGLFSHLREERSIVIVDDDPGFSQTLADTLRAQGYVVSEVTSPQSLASELQADVQMILVDVKLERADDLEVIEDIKDKFH